MGTKRIAHESDSNSDRFSAPRRVSSTSAGCFCTCWGKSEDMVHKDFNNTLINSRWRAYGPDGKFKQVVKLTHASKLRYERLGWTFTRPAAQVEGCD